MHIVALVFAIGTSSVSVGMGLMNPIGWDCWIASVPIECQESWLNGGKTDCERGDNANLYQWLFFYIPLWITIFGVTAIMMSIVHKVWVQERRNKVWRRKSVGMTSRSFRKTLGRSTSGSNAAAAQYLRGGRVEEVVWQSLFYVGGFYFAWTFPTILRITEVAGDVVYYHWVQLSATFIPTQGIWNLFVYLRPQYQRIKTQRRRREQQKQHQQELESQRKSAMEQEEVLQTNSGHGESNGIAKDMTDNGVRLSSRTIGAVACGTAAKCTVTTTDLSENDADEDDMRSPMFLGDLSDTEQDQVMDTIDDDDAGRHKHEIVDEEVPKSALTAARVSFAHEKGTMVNENTTNSTSLPASMVAPPSPLAMASSNHVHGHQDSGRSTVADPNGDVSSSTPRRGRLSTSSHRRRLFRRNPDRSTTSNGALSQNSSSAAISKSALSWMTHWVQGAVRDMGNAIRKGDAGDGGRLFAVHPGSGRSMGGRRGPRMVNGVFHSNVESSSAHVEDGTNNQEEDEVISVRAAAASVAAAVSEEEEEGEEEKLEDLEDMGVPSFWEPSSLAPSQNTATPTGT